LVPAATFDVQRRGKHLYNNTGALFSAWSVPSSYLEDSWRYSLVQPRKKNLVVGLKGLDAKTN
jgi:hypothetical protein